MRTLGPGMGLRPVKGRVGPSVIPAQAGIQGPGMGSGLRRGGPPSYRRRRRMVGAMGSCGHQGGRPSYRRTGIHGPDGSACAGPEQRQGQTAPMIATDVPVEPTMAVMVLSRASIWVNRPSI